MSPDEKTEYEFEQAMHGRLGEELARFAPPPHDLVRRATERGERQRRRSRAVRLTGAVVAVVALGAGGVLLHGGGAAAPSPASPVPSPTASTAAPPPSRLPDQPQDRLQARLLAMLPTRGKATAGKEDGPEYATALFDDGRGAGLVAVTVQSGMTAKLNGQLDCDRAPVGCTSVTLPGGTVVKSYQQSVDGNDTVLCTTVDTLRPDGRRVVVSAYNAPTDRGPATRSKPVLTPDELKAVALDPRWEGGAG
ncbi:hypothetical protein GCM10010441_02030 [Kitasatospora paracochleata]|uniref:Uncharacterized protein n=1 Tax=Kitasatospora paracochleata TaxID=58354 RepID=A0ABT1J2N9_9ACTN|nr:hypothetical protein [Kitasatospora paracochleata]MCP2311677.1 hypothetical protein [Kitasatospora paracochleata]